MSDQHSEERESWEYDAIEVQDKGVDVTKAPVDALISLELIAAADPRVLSVKNGQVVFRGGIFYNVVGWHERAKALIVRRGDA